MPNFTIAISSSLIQSVGATYPQGVSLVTSGRPDLLYIAIQNRDNQSIYFWHGDAYEDLAAQEAGTALPDNPNDWTAGQVTGFTTMITTYGEEIKAGTQFQPAVAHRGKVYSYVASGTANAAIKRSVL